MKTSVCYGGLDVHAESVVMAVAPSGSEPARLLGKTSPEGPQLLEQLKRVAPLSDWKVCYEAGPTGFGLQRFLLGHGVDCVVIAPSLVPVRSGARLKTDRRDACRLAHCLRSGDLTAIWVPDEPTEAVRDLGRARDDARLAERRARQQLLKFLLRHGRRFTGGSNWTLRHLEWIRQQQFTQEPLNRVLADYLLAAQLATDRVRRLTRELGEQIRGWTLEPLVRDLQAFHGIKLVTAAAIAAEIGDFQRFAQAGNFMGFLGLVPSEHSSGTTRKQGRITRTGNGHVRRLLVEAAWHYSDCRPGVSAALQKRRADVPAEVVAIADQAKRRLRHKAARMRAQRKLPTKIATALARELAGFIWAAALASTAPGKQPAGGADSGNGASLRSRTRAGAAAACERN